MTTACRACKTSLFSQLCLSANWVIGKSRAMIVAMSLKKLSVNGHQRAGSGGDLRFRARSSRYASYSSSLSVKDRFRLPLCRAASDFDGVESLVTVFDIGFSLRNCKRKRKRLTFVWRVCLG